MNSLSLIVFFHIFTGIHGKENTYYCKRYKGMEELFKCFHIHYQNKKGCMEIIKMAIHSVEQTKVHNCAKYHGTNRCTQDKCRKILSSSIESLRKQRMQKADDDNKKDSHNSNENTDADTNGVNKVTKRKENGEQNERKKDKNFDKKRIFKVGAIVGISAGITGTIILVMIILAIIYVCRRRSKKKKRKHLTRQQDINQRLQMKNYESESFSTNQGGYNVLSAKIPLNTDEAQGKHFIFDPFITKYDKDLSNRKLPEIKRCSGADGDDNVYYEIDEDKIKCSTDIDGVYQNNIKEFTGKGSYHSDQTKTEIQLGSIKKKRAQLTKQQSIDQRSEIASLESSPFSPNNRANSVMFANESLNTEEEQGEYFVLDPSITKTDKDLSRLDLPEIKRFSVAHGDKRVYNEIDEDEIQPPTDMEDVRQKKIEVEVKFSYHGDQNMYEIPRSTKSMSEKQTRPLSVDQRTEVDLQNSPSGTNKGDKVIMSVNESLNTDELQGEYFVLDPSVTKYDKGISNLALPEVKSFSVAHGDENVYNQIDEGTFESSTDVQVHHQKQIEDDKDISIYRTDHINHDTQLGIPN